MFVTLQFKESIFSILQRKAANLKISVEDLVHQFVDVQIEDDIKINNFPSKTQSTWVDEIEEDARTVMIAQENFMHELEQDMAEMDAEIESEYGSGLDLLYNTAGMFGKGLPEGEVRYLVESPAFSQHALRSAFVAGA